MFDPVLLFIIVICLFELQCYGFTGCILHNRNCNRCTDTSLFSSKDDDEPSIITSSTSGDLEKLKAEEERLASLLASVRKQKLDVLRGMCLYVFVHMMCLFLYVSLTSYLCYIIARPLNIGIIGFGRFGQFIAKSFAKYGNVIGTSRTDYTEIANEIGVSYIPISNLESFVVEEDLDVIVIAVSIVSFEQTVQDLVPHLEKRMEVKGIDSCPLIVDVASVKEHPRQILLDNLPVECDICCTHPMFGPDSAKDGWQGQTFVYEKTRINKVVKDPIGELSNKLMDELIGGNNDEEEEPCDTPEEEGEDEQQPAFFDSCKSVDDSYVDGVDRIERFLSIWEEEGCKMIPMSCHDHDAYSADSQFITHLMGRILGAQGLEPTPIDTKGFQSVIKLIETTNADSFDLFYGLYKYNRNSGYTIGRLRGALDDVVGELLTRDGVVGVFDNRRKTE